MKDEELEVWRRQWHSQPAVPIDLIRKVERQTVYMRLNWIAQILPGLVGVGTIIAAIVMRGVWWIILATGTLLFIAIGWSFMIENKRGVWAPAAETTAAYLELSVERCLRKLREIRFTKVFTLLLTAFVFLVDYATLASAGALNRASDYLVMGGAFLLAILVVSVILMFQDQKRRKTEAELTYLLNLQRSVSGGSLFAP